MALVQQANQSFLFLSLEPVLINFHFFLMHYHFGTVCLEIFLTAILSFLLRGLYYITYNYLLLSFSSVKVHYVLASSYLCILCFGINYYYKKKIYKSLVTLTTDCPVGKTVFQASTSMYTVLVD